MSNIWVVILLLFNFFYRLYIYFNTKVFGFGDYKLYLDAVEQINRVGYIPLQKGSFLYLNSYLGYFFKYVLNNFDYYFIFNCIIGSIATFIIYYFLRKVFNDGKIGLIYLIIISIYSEFIVLSSIFYTQIIEILMASIIILMVYKLHYVKNIYRSLLYISLIVLVINISYFFKGTMRYLWFIFFIISIFNMSGYKIFTKYIILTLLLLSVKFSLNIFYPDISSIINVHDINNSNAIGFIFMGHTLYGGDGGEGTFIYKENRQRYDFNYNKWLKDNNIPSHSTKSEVNFRKHEILKFITEHPFQWIQLQVYKIFRTFGIIPEGSSFTILFSGLFNYNWILTSLFLQIPFALIFILFILTFDFKIITNYINKKFSLIWVGLFVYWLCGTVFYGPFQERYRIPIMVIFIIPALSIFLSNFNYKTFTIDKKSLILKSISMLILFSIWGSQAYNALVINSDRYFNFVDEVNRSDQPDIKIRQLYNNTNNK